MSISSYTESEVSSKMLSGSSEIPDFEDSKSYQIKRGTTIVTTTKSLTIVEPRDSEAMFNKAFQDGVRTGLKQFEQDTNDEDKLAPNRLYLTS